MAVETFVDEYGEKRYRIALREQQWREVILPLLRAERYPNERAIDAIREAIAKAMLPGETVPITFAVTEAAAVSAVMG